MLNLNTSALMEESSSESLELLLLAVAKNELITHKIYNLLRSHSGIGEVPEMHRLIESASTEDYTHYHDIVDCLETLQGKPCDVSSLTSGVNLTEGSRYGTSYLLSMTRLLEISLIDSYKKICHLTFGRDFKVFDLSFRILNENLEHENSLTDLIRRRNTPSSPVAVPPSIIL